MSHYLIEHILPIIITWFKHRQYCKIQGFFGSWLLDPTFEMWMLNKKRLVINLFTVTNIDYTEVVLISRQDQVYQFFHWRSPLIKRNRSKKSILENLNAQWRYFWALSFLFFPKNYLVSLIWSQNPNLKRLNSRVIDFL